MAKVKNFHVRIIRKHLNGQVVPDCLVNEIALVEQAGYNFTTDQLLELLKDIELPGDIMLQYKHTWDGDTRNGDPSNILSALKNDGYVDAQHINSWTVTTPDTPAAQKIIVYDKHCINALKRVLWDETSLDRIDWQRPVEVREQLKMARPQDPLEWWY